MDIDPYTTVDWITNLWPGNFAGPMFYRMKAMVTPNALVPGTEAICDECTGSVTIAARDVAISGTIVAKEIGFWKHARNASLPGYNPRMPNVVTLDMRGTFIDKLDLVSCFTYPNHTLETIIFGDMREIGDRCLRVFSQLKVVDFSAVTRLEKIGEEFMSGSRFIGKIDLSHLKLPISFGPGFMYRVKGLKSVRLPPRILSIGFAFLVECRDLDEIDLSPLHSLEKIPSGFLGRTISLRCIGPAPLVLNCTDIGDCFLSGSGLSTVNISFPSLTTIGGRFMFDCPHLIKVNLAFSQEVCIGDEFMWDSKKLTSLDLGTAQIRTTGISFLTNCVSIDEFRVGKIPTDAVGFMQGCPEKTREQALKRYPSKAQCSAIRKSGTRCTRMAEDSSGLCGRHKKK